MDGGGVRWAEACLWKVNEVVNGRSRQHGVWLISGIASVVE